MQIGHFMTEMVFKALAIATPDNIIADSGGTPDFFWGEREDGLGIMSDSKGRQRQAYPEFVRSWPVFGRSSLS